MCKVFLIWLKFIFGFKDLTETPDPSIFKQVNQHVKHSSLILTIKLGESNVVIGMKRESDHYFLSLNLHCQIQ